MHIQEIRRGDMDWIDLPKARDRRRGFVNKVMNFQFP
jgi:hypothetical protein